MIQRTWRWLIAGVLAVWLLAGMLIGAGVAVADDGSGSSSAKESSSQSSNSTEKKQDSGDDAAKPKPKKRKRDTEDKPASATTRADDDTTRKPSDHLAKRAERADDTKKSVDRKAAKAAAVPTHEAEPTTSAAARVDETAVESEPKQAAVATTFAVAAPKASVTSVVTKVINAVGNLAFNVLALVTNLGAGPPVLPPDTTVTVSRSSLVVGGKTVKADWYFPNEDAPPTGLIYLQHGAFAVSSMYSYTAADLAEQTNSIVVAPTMSTNGFAPDGMWLGGAPLQEAVADLFEGDRDALTASAQAAGYEGTLPQQFVLAGHSLGGSFVTAVAGDLADDHATDDLKGVVLFDPVASAGQDSLVPDALAKLPADLPVLAVGSPPSSWNELGAAANALAAARDGEFVGVILDHGSHGDAAQGGNPLIQLILNVATGVPRKANIAAAETLASGWITDMYADRVYDPATRTGIYSAPGEVFPIDTPAGTATAYALPDTHHKPSLFQVLLSKLVDVFSSLGTA
jgi:pimeloyl-ACP methyl ester carboxylesterase